jgi:hypothetical protein
VRALGACRRQAGGATTNPSTDSESPRRGASALYLKFSPKIIPSSLKSGLKKMTIFQKIITFFLWEIGLSKNSRTCTKVFSTLKKIINRIAAILDSRKIAQVEKHAKNTFFGHTPLVKVKN